MPEISRFQKQRTDQCLPRARDGGEEAVAAIQDSRGVLAVTEMPNILTMVTDTQTYASYNFRELNTHKPVQGKLVKFESGGYMYQYSSPA